MHRHYRPLEECCRNGNAKQLEQSLERAEELHLPYDLNQQNGDTGDTCLQITAACGQADCVQVLLNRGADCFVKNGNGATALHVASSDNVLGYLLPTGEILYSSNQESLTATLTKFYISFYAFTSYIKLIPF